MGATAVSLEQSFAMCQLADLGVRVVKVEQWDSDDFVHEYSETVRGLSRYFM